MSDKQKSGIWFALLLIFMAAILFPLVHKILNPSFGVAKQDIHVLFKESIMRVVPNQGDVLEVAIVESEDTFTRSDSKSLFDNLIYLGTTISEIKVKVTYRYHILLSDEWTLQLKGKDLEVVPPAIRPSLPPAIHTDEMEKRTQAGWLRFNAQENLEKLESSLTPSVTAVAVSPEKVKLVKEAARITLESFVKKWVLVQPQWQDLAIENIKILYPAEAGVWRKD